MAAKEGGVDEKQVPAGDADSILSFWENPANRELIVNAKPLESLITEKMALDYAKNFCISSHLIESDSDETSDLSEDFDRIDLQSEPSKPRACFSEVDCPVLETPPLLQATMNASSSKNTKTFVKNVSDTFKSMKVDFQQFVGNAQTLAKNVSDKLQSYEGDIQQVADTDLTEFPACNVGKVFWRKSRDLYWSTAFYIGNQTIMTVAHVFYNVPIDVTIQDAVFIPAMIDKEDIHGQHFGFYETKLLSPFAPYYPQFEKDIAKRQPWNDYAVLRLKNGRCKKHSDVRNPDLAEHVEQFMDCTMHKEEPICLATPTCASSASDPTPTFTVYGYGEVNDDSDDLWENGSKMTKVTGSIFPETGISRILDAYQATQLIGIDVVIREGMSGGPWMQGDCAAGIQCESSRPRSFLKSTSILLKNKGILPKDVHLSLSPRFSDEIMKQISKRLTP